MDMTAVRAHALTVALATHGVAATVTPPGEAAVITRVQWVLGAVDESLPIGRDFQRREPRRVLIVPLTAALTDVPRGSVIVAPPPGSVVARNWRVENVDRADADQVRVIVAAS